MQNRIAYTNSHAHTEFIGGVMIPPGETREIDATHHPDYCAPGTGAGNDSPSHIVDVLLAGDVATLLAHVPVLSVDDLQELSDREQAGARRENVLSALAEQLLTLASEQVDGTGQGDGDVQPAGDAGGNAGSNTPASTTEQPKATAAKSTAKKAAGA